MWFPCCRPSARLTTRTALRSGSEAGFNKENLKNQNLKATAQASPAQEPRHQGAPARSAGEPIGAGGARGDGGAKRSRKRRKPNPGAKNNALLCKMFFGGGAPRPVLLDGGGRADDEARRGAPGGGLPTPRQRRRRPRSGGFRAEGAKCPARSAVRREVFRMRSRSAGGTCPHQEAKPSGGRRRQATQAVGPLKKRARHQRRQAREIPHAKERSERRQRRKRTERKPAKSQERPQGATAADAVRRRSGRPELRFLW